MACAAFGVHRRAGVRDGFSEGRAFADSAGRYRKVSELRDDRWPKRRGLVLDRDLRLSIPLLCVRPDAKASNAASAQAADIVATRLVSSVRSMQVCRARRRCIIIQNESSFV